MFSPNNSITESMAASHTSGNIHLIIGPMFSGKTNELMRLYDRVSIWNSKCMIVKYSNDNRYSNECLATHNNRFLEATSVDYLSVLESDKKFIESEYVFIDEIQFYKDAVDFCEKWANKGKNMIVCGLSGDFRREPFEQVSRLISKADNVQFLTAVCKQTGTPAPFSLRTSNEQSVEVIGGTDKYEAVCREIYNKNS